MDIKERIKLWSSGDRFQEQIVDYFETIELELTHLKKQLKQSNLEQNQLEMALCHTQDATSITNSSFSIRMVNPAFEKLTGYSGASIVGKTHDHLWDPSVSSKIKDLRNTISNGRDWKGEMTIKTSSGKNLITEMSVAPVVDYLGKISHYVYSFHNITKRIELENSLKQQKNFLEKVINLSSNLVIILDKQGNWLLDNLATKTLLTDIGNNSRKIFSNQLLDSIESRASQKSKKLEVVLKDNRKKIFFLQSEKIPSDYLRMDGKDDLVNLITLSDITESEKNNRKVVVQQRELISSNLEKKMIQEELINGITFRLKQPLKVSGAILEQLQQLFDTNQYAVLPEKIGNLRLQIENIKKELSEFTRLYHKKPIEQNNTLSEELLEAIIVLYQNRQSSVDIEAICLKEGKIMYRVPCEFIQLMLKILMDNALESVRKSQRKQFIRVTFSEDQNQTSITVEDSGVGIDKKEHLKIFEPFHTTKQNHSGLSLTLLHQMIHQFDGKIDTKTSTLGGASFKISFSKEG